MRFFIYEMMIMLIHKKENRFYTIHGGMIRKSDPNLHTNPVFVFSPSLVDVRLLPPQLFA